MSKHAIFIHIPKSGGTTFREICKSKYLVGEHWYFVPPLNNDSLSAVLKMAPSNIRRIKMISGHHPYGLHKLLDEPTPRIYLTMLRHPVDRTVSLFNYLNKINLYPELRERGMGFLDFIKSGINQTTDNGMTRYLCGDSGSAIPYGEVSLAHARQAIENMNNHFAFVGLSEKFDLSMLVIQKILGWKYPPWYVPYNQTKLPIITVEALSSAEKDFLLDFLRPDIMLYEEARRLFPLKVESVLGEHFRKKEQKFIFRNALVGPAARYYYAFKRRVLS